MAVNLMDVLECRTHLIALARDQGLAAAEPVAGVMAAELGWTPEVRAAQIEQYQRQVALSRRWRCAEA
jgi:glycerol-3-phosphate dehydrogenase